MSNTIGKTPIEKREEHDVLDSTKLKTFQSCPREFFFSYILGWRSKTANVHLAFGSAWHEALEYLHTKGMSDQNIKEAFFVFQEIFNKEYSPLMNEEHKAKNAENAGKALQEYAHAYRDKDDFEVLFTETAGTAPVRGDRVIHFKCDLILEDRNGDIWSMEHKTTGRGGRTWKSRWPLDFQVNAYAHAVSSLFADRYGDVAGVKINGAILRKSGNNEFVRIPCRKTADQLRLWVQECNHWIDMLEWNMEILAETSVSDDIMFAFPRNPTSCTKYGCAFDGMCERWTNPLRRCEEPPPGYEEDHWDPRRQEDEADNVVHIDQDEEESDGEANTGRFDDEEGSSSDGKSVRDDSGLREQKDDGGRDESNGGNSGGLIDVS